jgi:hypothetical protein
VLWHRIDHDAGYGDAHGQMHVGGEDGECVCAVHGVVTGMNLQVAARVQPAGAAHTSSSRTAQAVSGLILCSRSARKGGVIVPGQLSWWTESEEVSWMGVGGSPQALMARWTVVVQEREGRDSNRRLAISGKDRLKAAVARPR